jgi:hypothetical protein
MSNICHIWKMLRQLTRRMSALLHNCQTRAAVRRAHACISQMQLADVSVPASRQQTCIRSLPAQAKCPPCPVPHCTLLHCTRLPRGIYCATMQAASLSRVARHLQLCWHTAYTCSSRPHTAQALSELVCCLTALSCQRICAGAACGTHHRIQRGQSIAQPTKAYRARPYPSSNSSNMDRPSSAMTCYSERAAFCKPPSCFFLLCTPKYTQDRPRFQV